MHDAETVDGSGRARKSGVVTRGASGDPKERFRRLFAGSLVAALIFASAIWRAVPVGAAVGWVDSTAQTSEDLWEEFSPNPVHPEAGGTGGRGAGSARTRSQAQPGEELPAEGSETRFPANRIIIAVILQALLLAVVAGFILWMRSTRRRGHPDERSSARFRMGGRLKSNSESRRSSSRHRAGPLEPVGSKRVVRRPAVSIGGRPERGSSGYMSLTLTDGRTVEGVLRGAEGNGHVLIVDVDYVIEPDGSRRRGSPEDSFVPVTTIERQRRVEGPRSA